MRRRRRSAALPSPWLHLLLGCLAVAGCAERPFVWVTDLPLSPNNANLRPAISRGKSQYDALILSVRRRMYKGLDFTGAYTLGKALSNIGASSDALDASLIQGATNPFDDPRVFGPNSLTDARHRVTISAVWQAPARIQVAPIYIFRTALPVSVSRSA